MKISQISKGLDAVHSAIDFIADATDSDETGIGSEMLEGLSELKKALSDDQYKYFLKVALARLRRQNKQVKKP